MEFSTSVIETIREPYLFQIKNEELGAPWISMQIM